MDKKKPRTSAAGRPSNAGRASLPFQIPIGLPGMDMDMDDMLDDDVADEDLEAELDALMNGQEIKAPRPRQTPTKTSPAVAPQRGAPVAPPRGARKSTPSDGKAPPPSMMPSRIMDFDLSAIERMGQDDPEDEDVDEDDPELLAELQELSPDVSPEDTAPSFPASKTQAPSSSNNTSSSKSAVLTMLQERLENYEGAHQDALYEKEASKVRRYDRSIKTIKEQIAQAKKGQLVADEDVPPPIFIKSVLQNSLADSRPFPSEPTHLAERTKEKALDVPLSKTQTDRASPVSAVKTPAAVLPSAVLPSAVLTPPASDQRVVSLLKERRDQYRQAALKANKCDNKPDAIRFMKIFKEFEMVIKAAEEGQEVDTSEMPPPPDQLPRDLPDSTTSLDVVPKSSIPLGPQTSPATQKATPTKALIEDDADIPDIDPSEVKAAFKAPDAPKTVLEALQQRLEKYKSTYDEAKTSGDLSKARRMQRIVKQYQDAIKDYQAKRPVDFEELPTPPGFGPIPSGRPTAAAVPTSNNPTLPSQTAAPARPSISHSLPSGRESRQEQQHRFLTERQHQFKLAALKAKKEGATETARLYLRQANGLKPMIEASANGLPVDLTSVPKAPPGMGSEADAEYDVVQYEDAGAQPPVTSTKSRTEVYSQLEKDLVEQVGMCVRNTQHFKKSGDIPMAEKFEKFNQQSRKDLDSLRNAFNHSLPTPRFHYETRTFSVVKCCPELPENVMELSVIRGFGYTLKDFAATDFVTYVKWDFPYPAEAPQTGRTLPIKGTNEPEYNSTHNIQINRKSRSMPRLFKAKGIKFEVYVRMGFLKADKILGTVHVSLETLETKCVHHTSIDLLEGKKAVGGKLEIKVRIREPLLRQQVEELREKWLVIDQFVR